MNSNLLVVIPLHHKKTPIMLDRVPAPSDPEAGPFLISSSRSLIWVARAFEGGFLRLAIRSADTDTIYREIVESVAQEGLDKGWGNVHPPTKEGVLEGMNHLSYYGFSDFTLLYGDEFDISLCLNMDRAPASWLPSSWAVMVPGREYVGTVYKFDGNKSGVLVHNPSRGIVIIK